MIIGGIDPGVTGGVAIIDDEGGCETIDMPTMLGEEQKVVDGLQLADWLSERVPNFVVVEAIHAIHGCAASSTFTLGAMYGGALSALRARRIPWKLVTPKRWKGDMGLGRDKDASRLLAIAKFPNAAQQFARKRDHGRAEAALIAKWWMTSGFKLKRAA